MQEMTLRTRMIARKGFSCTAAPVALAILMCSTAAPAQAQVPCPREIKPGMAPCPCIATTNVTFKTDLVCMNSDGIIVKANGITIRFNGFRLICQGAGFGFSCQGGDGADAMDSEPKDIGVKIDGIDYVTVRGGGAIQGFDTGVLVRGASDYVTIEKLNVTGPDADLGALATGAGSRPDTEGILVEGTSMYSGIDIFANSVDNHTAGIKLQNAKGVEVRLNFAHDNNGGSSRDLPSEFITEGHGIHLVDSSDNKVHNNLIVDNGFNVPDDSGIMLDGSVYNRINGNNVSFSNGDGISVRQGSANNVIDDNQILYNTSTENLPVSDPARNFFDLASRAGAGANTFNTNNRCETEGGEGGTVPANVCNAGEGEPWTKKP